MCHWAPVLRIHSAASSTLRAAIGLRPRTIVGVVLLRKMLPDRLPLRVRYA